MKAFNRLGSITLTITHLLFFSISTSYFSSPNTVTALTLLRGGTIISYNNSTSDIEIIDEGSILFDDRIIAISDRVDGLDGHERVIVRESEDEDMTIVNTTGKIISPGFIDTHRYTW